MPRHAKGRVHQVGGGKQNHTNLSKVTSELKVGDCAEKYLEAVANPFQPHSACLPVWPSCPSGNGSYFVRGQTTTSSTSPYTGYVMFSPFRGVAKDMVCTYASTSAWNPSNPMGSDNPQALSTNSPWEASQFLPSGSGNPVTLKCRLYAAGLRVRYTGTALNKGGTIFGAFTPMLGWWEGHDETLRGLQIASHSDFDSVWYTVLWTPCDPMDTMFCDRDSRADVFATDSYPICIAINPAVASAPFEYEAWVHFELQGYYISNISVPRHVDPLAGQAVVAAVSTTGGPGSKDKPMAVKKNILSRLTHSFETATSYAPAISRVANAATNVLLSGSGQRLAITAGERAAALAPLLLDA